MYLTSKSILLPIVFGAWLFSSPVTAQYTTMVCQTNSFWCNFLLPAPGAGNGLPCHCAFIPGYTINPITFQGPQPPLVGRKPKRQTPTHAVPSEVGDCLNGLGDCKEMINVAAQGTSQDGRTRPSLTASGCRLENIKRMVDAGNGKRLIRKTCGKLVADTLNCKTNDAVEAFEDGNTVNDLLAGCD